MYSEMGTQKTPKKTNTNLQVKCLQLTSFHLGKINMWINLKSAALRVWAIFVPHLPISFDVIWILKIIHLSQARKNIISDSETDILLHFAFMPFC